jgi:hypothetical protein
LDILVEYSKRVVLLYANAAKMLSNYHNLKQLVNF